MSFDVLTLLRKSAFGWKGWLVLGLLGLTGGSVRAQVYEKVYSFTNAAALKTRGATPVAPLIQSSDGNFYGTTFSGGSGGEGTVFRMTPAGVLTTLASFNGANGANPVAGLIQGSDGNFYGTTFYGGSSNLGTVFKITPAGSLTTLVKFKGKTGEVPNGLTQGNDGNFYGTTTIGGTGKNGTVFRMTPEGVLTTLVNFNGINDESPAAALVQGNDGNFYGTTIGGDESSNLGTVFKVTRTGVLTTLVKFDGSNGSVPEADLIKGSDGNFYGTTSGEGGIHKGTIFKMTPAGVLTTLVESNKTDKSLYSASTLIQGGDGNFYGTTLGVIERGAGTIFKMTPAGVFTTLVKFHGANGDDPQAALVQGADGNFYGTTSSGGLFSDGTVFNMNSAGILTTLVNFNDTLGGDAQPQAGLIQGSDGNFYGTTARTVFRITTAGVLTTLVDFDAPISSFGTGSDGLILGRDGNFYGTTTYGGKDDVGTVFKMSPSGDLTTLVDFSETKGNYPSADLTQGRDGNFYGTTSFFHFSASGTVFKMTPAGFLTTLVKFNGTDGDSPEAKLIQGRDGNFYGTTNGGGRSHVGTVFKMTPTGVLTKLVDFDSANGEHPVAALVQGRDGNFFGTTSGDDTTSYGTVFKITPAGVLKTLVKFNQTNGAQPVAGLIQARDGNFYGTTSGDDYTTHGTVFKITTAGTLTTLYNFSADLEDSGPTAPLVQAADGNLYGTTFGNESGLGCIYRLIMQGAPNIYLKQSLSDSTSSLFTVLANARGAASSVALEYGTNGVSFPNNVPISATLSGYTTTLLGTTLTGLKPGVVYYYRVVAKNSLGTTIMPPTDTAAATFTTLAAPKVTIAAATDVVPTGAQLNGTVDAFNNSTSAVFQYGTDPNFPANHTKTVAVIQGPVAGPKPEKVSATVTGLKQGTTYYYRLSATNAATTTGPVQSGAASFTGLQQTAPSKPVAAGGALLVNLTPAASKTFTPGWHFVGEQLWRAAGSEAKGLVTGNYPIEYEPAPGYNQPPPETVFVTSGLEEVISRIYYSAPGRAPVGALEVMLSPPNLKDPEWQLAGQTAWRKSGATLTGLIPGNYEVQCKPVANQITPAVVVVSVKSGPTTVVTLTYVAALSAKVKPGLVPAASLTTSPYAYVGQIRTDLGSATGFVVTSHVVATAAHVVFNDAKLSSDHKGKLSWVTGLQWLFQREAGSYEPVPQIPLGVFVYSGYASARQADGTPGTSSPTSENRDVAAIYFAAPAGGGGSSGFLSSDATVNAFMTSSSPKVLVGYPVDGNYVAGQLYATPTTPPLTAALKQVTDSSKTVYQVYTTTALSSVGGNSGGPLCVALNGIYYPAAIYLGGSAVSTVVRAIDSTVVTLFDKAETAGESGSADHLGGGHPLVSVGLNAASASEATLQVNFTPAQASGATWNLDGTFLGFTGSMLYPGSLSPGKYTFTSSPVAGFVTPAAKVISLTGGKQYVLTVDYANGITQQPAATSSAAGSATFAIKVSGSPTKYQWYFGLPTGTHKAVANGKTATLTLTNLTAADVGTYYVFVTWSNGSVTSNTISLTAKAIKVAQAE